jgi:hypothetical protein
LSSEPLEDSLFVNFDMTECSWENVFNEVRHAKTAYEQKADRNPIRRCFRHGHGFQRNLKPLAEVIPGENGVGLIKGAMQIVLNVRNYAGLARYTANEVCAGRPATNSDMPENLRPV